MIMLLGFMGGTVFGIAVHMLMVSAREREEAIERARKIKSAKNDQMRYNDWFRESVQADEKR